MNLAFWNIQFNTEVPELSRQQKPLEHLICEGSVKNTLIDFYAVRERMCIVQFSHCSWEQQLKVVTLDTVAATCSSHPRVNAGVILCCDTKWKKLPKTRSVDYLGWLSLFSGGRSLHPVTPEVKNSHWNNVDGHYSVGQTLGCPLLGTDKLQPWSSLHRRQTYSLNPKQIKHTNI